VVPRGTDLAPDGGTRMDKKAKTPKKPKTAKPKGTAKSA
jgi:hypothetical protein